MSEKIIYIVIARRWGDDSEHSYLLGAFDEKDKAIDCANSHCAERGGKYACLVEKCTLNHYDEDDETYTEEIYRAKSLMY